MQPAGWLQGRSPPPRQLQRIQTVAIEQNSEGTLTSHTLDGCHTHEALALLMSTGATDALLQLLLRLCDTAQITAFCRSSLYCRVTAHRTSAL